MVCLSNECSNESIEGLHESIECSREELSYIIAKAGLQLVFSYKVLKEFKRNLMKAISEKILYKEEKKKLVDELHIIKNQLRPYVQRLGGVMFDIHVILEENRMKSIYFEKKVQKFTNLKDVLKKISDMTERVSKKVTV